jgi:hypothetical protein
VVFLNAYFKANVGPFQSFRQSSTTMTSPLLEFLIFIGLLNTFLLVRFFIYYLILVLIPIALLICTENTFWDISRDGTPNFVELFKKSFTSYVKSGMRERVERDIDVLRNEQGEFLVTKDFKAKFYKFIVDHYLRKFRLTFYLHSTNLTTGTVFA